jgi:hypothetical protein
MLAKESNSHALACRAPLENNPKYSRIYQKMALKLGEEASEEQLKDGEMITNQDIQSGIDWYGEYQYCMAKQIEDTAKIDPALAILTSNVQKKQVLLLNDIVSNHLT